MEHLKRGFIVGGGIGGLTVALALKRAGIEVEVHEKFTHLQGRETRFTIWSYAIGNLVGLGISEERLDSVGSAIEATELRNGAGKLLELMPVGQVARKLGAPSYDCARGDLLAALIDAIGAEALHMGSGCVGSSGRGIVRMRCSPTAHALQVISSSARTGFIPSFATRSRGGPGSSTRALSARAGSSRSPTTCCRPDITSSYGRVGPRAASPISVAIAPAGMRSPAGDRGRLHRPP